MYTVLTGAKINMGDFLITERCMALLRAHLPEHELFVLPCWEPLDAHLDRINSGDAVIIMGGPGFQPGFYPRVYRLTADLDRIRVPVVPMGLGWKGYPGDERTLRTYRFSASSRRAIERFSAQARYMGCRDYLTCELLERNGVRNALMTGCPVWYRLDAIGRGATLPSEVAGLTVTPAQRHLYRDQSIAMLELLARRFEGATRFCAFNRGIDRDDPLIPPADRANNRVIAAAARRLGYEVIDTSGGTDRIGFHERCDLHVGYRVHTHLHFLSARKPSILLHEDGRGRGVSQAIGTPGVDAFVIRELLGARRIRPDAEAIPRLDRCLAFERASGFARFSGVGAVIDAHYEVMKRFIRALPGARRG